MAIFGKDYHIIGNLFTAVYRDKYLIHVASCTDKVLRYLCFTFPLEPGKGPSLAIEDGRYWENEAGDEWNFVFRDGNLTYTLEFFEINENPPILQINLKIRDAQGQITSWELDDCSLLPINTWGIFDDHDQPL